MNANEKIEKEKLDNILNPRNANSEFKITIKFQKHLSQNFEKALALARQNRYFMEDGVGDQRKFYVSFQPGDVCQLHQLFDLVHQHKKTEIYLNNKRIPYIHDLWLFLMWFYRY